MLGPYLELAQLIAFDHLQAVSERLFGPADQPAGVAAIGEDLGDAVEAAEQAHPHGAGRHVILDASRMHDDSQQGCLACLPRCGACGP